MVDAALSLVAHWGFRHLGLVTRQPRPRAQLWLGAGTAAAAEEKTHSQAGSGGLVVPGGAEAVPQLSNLRNSLSLSQLQHTALPQERGLQGPPHKFPHSKPSGFRVAEGRLSGSREKQFALFGDYECGPVGLTDHRPVA